MKARIGLNVAFGAVAAMSLTTLGLAACSTEDRSVIDVYAASSLTDAFTRLEAEFEAAHPEVDVRLNLAGSNTLHRQILNGADVDVFAPADPALLDDLATDSTGQATPYASNTLTLVVPSPAPGDDSGNADDEASTTDQAHSGPVSGPGDLISPEVILARCAPGVPCGDAADAFLDREGIEPARSTDEANVRSVLNKVASGEVDAGLVYATDARSTSTVIDLGLDQPPQVAYSLLVLSANPDAAAFARFVASDQAAAVFGDLGFGPPAL